MLVRGNRDSQFEPLSNIRACHYSSRAVWEQQFIVATIAQSSFPDADQPCG